MLLAAIFLSFLALPALAAEPADAPQAGREAKIHLLDGTVVECVVLGFADGSFQIKRSGREDAVPINKIERITFGKAVGESVRNPFAPEPPEKKLREDRIRSLDTPQLVHRLARWTGRYRNAESLKQTEAGARRMLAKKPEKGPLDINLRFLLVLLKTADGEMQTAKRFLSQLKRDYADDEFLQDVRIGRLATTIERIKQTGRGPGRPGRRRPPRRERDRDTDRPRPGPPPPE